MLFAIVLGELEAVSGSWKLFNALQLSPTEPTVGNRTLGTTDRFTNGRRTGRLSLSHQMAKVY